MDFLEIVRSVHFVGAIALLNARIGMLLWLFYCYPRDHEQVTPPFRTILLVEAFFIAPVWLAQPVSGAALVHLTARNWADPRLMMPYGLYWAALLAWVISLFLLHRLRALTSQSSGATSTYSRAIRRLFLLCLTLNGAGSATTFAIFWLMIDGV